MMMLALAVHVAVCKLLRSGGAYIEYGAVEAQALPRKGMIAIDDDLAIGDIGA